MPLRSPLYLDLETLTALAEYHEVEVPRAEEIVERTVRKRSGRASAAVAGIGGAVEGGRDVEVQRSYSLTPKDKVVVSRAIDELVREGHVSQLDDQTRLQRGTWVEVEGVARMTTASLVGKLLYVLRDALQSSDVDMSNLEFADVAPDVLKRAKEVYIGGELVPMPILLEIAPAAHDTARVYVSLEPGLFVDDAAQERIEGAVTILGVVDRVIPADEYFSAEQWILHGYEWLLRRLLLPRVDDVARQLVDSLTLDLPADDVSAYFSGPAIVIKGTALY